MQQVTFFDGQIKRLTNSITALKGILQDGDADIDLKAVAQAKRTESAAKAPGNKVDIGRTNKEFWLGLITDTKQKTEDIVSSAAKALSIDPATDHEKMAILKQRLAQYLKILTASGEIKSEGERKTRVFFK